MWLTEKCTQVHVGRGKYRHKRGRFASSYNLCYECHARRGTGRGRGRRTGRRPLPLPPPHPRPQTPSTAQGPGTPTV